MSAIFAAALGQAIVGPLNGGLINIMPPHPRAALRGVPSWLMGVVKCSVFAPAVYLAPKEAAIGAFAWLGLKMAANWQQPVEPNIALIHTRHSVRALLLGFLSLSIAAASGVYFRWLCHF